MESPIIPEQQNSVKPILSMWVVIPLYIIAWVILVRVFTTAAYIPKMIFPQTPVVVDFYLSPGPQVIGSILSAVCVWLISILFLKYIDLLPASTLGLSIKGRGTDIVMGFIFAAILYALGFGFSILIGAIQIDSIQPDAYSLIISLIFFFFAAAAEEIMFRGYIMNRFMSRMNKFAALAGSSLLFALMHIFNPNFAFLPMFNLFLAGMLLGAAFMYTRNLWFPTVLHLGWNWIQGPILGYNVSGVGTFPGMIQQNYPEDNLINGGSFGFEGSIVCTVLCILGTLAIIAWFEWRNTNAETVKD